MKLWYLAAVLLAGGLCVLNLRYEAPIRAAEIHSEQMYRESRQNEMLLAQASSLSHLRQTLFERLQRYGGNASPSGNDAQFIGILDTCAKRMHVQISLVQPDPAAHMMKRADPGSPALTSTSATIGIRGRFADVLHFVQALSHQRTAVEVRRVSIARRRERRGADKTLEATIAVVLYRFTPTALKAIHAGAN